MAATDTIVRKAVAAKFKDGRVAVGFDSGDRDEVGTPDEVAYLHDVVVFDEDDKRIAEFPAYGVLAADIFEAGAKHVKFAYASYKFGAAADALNEAIAAIEAAKVEHDKFEALYNEAALAHYA